MKDYGFARVAAAVPQVSLGGIQANLEAVISLCDRGKKEEVDILLFPELVLSSYSCEDLFYQPILLRKVEEALLELAEKSFSYPFPIVLGLPLMHHSLLYNCAAVVYQGEILGVVPKVYLPSRGEFYESRWFQSGWDQRGGALWLGGREIPFGVDLLFQDRKNPLLRFGVEICEDLWAPTPPGVSLALGGALLLLNPSASDEIMGKGHFRKNLIAAQGIRCLAAYAYASVGPGESTRDAFFGGRAFIYERGKMIREGASFSLEDQFLWGDVDLESIDYKRLKSSSFSQAAQYNPATLRVIPYDGGEERRPPAPSLSAHPFLPTNEEERGALCEEILSIQVGALAGRLRNIGCDTLVLGLSGGLDSTLALLVALKAFRLLGLPLQGLRCYTLPGFGTTRRTLGNVLALCREWDIPLEEVDVKEICQAQLGVLGHSGAPQGNVYENVQARQRTLFLMNKANMLGGIVLGTGDLSELALGWCTYGGDHMSMYAINAGVPKTVIPRLLASWIGGEENQRVRDILQDIINTPISPELLPPDGKGEIAQKTEDLVGPYELHDFFLYHMLQRGAGAKKIYYLAGLAFAERYSKGIIKKWLIQFLKRFFSQQFKRSCMPDGPKVSHVSLSPRGDWRMPSEGTAELWIQELESLE